MGLSEQAKHGTCFPYQTSYWSVTAFFGYLFICFGVKDAIPGVKVSMIWLTGLYFIHTMGEIALSPIGLSMVNKLSPLRFASLMMGIWYLSTATANKFAGMLERPLSRSTEK